MGHPNDPRRMTPRGNSARERVFDNSAGDAGRDGYTRLARRIPPGRETDSGDNMSSPFMSMRSDAIKPEVGERDHDRLYRHYTEDF